MLEKKLKRWKWRRTITGVIIEKLVTEGKSEEYIRQNYSVAEVLLAWLEKNGYTDKPIDTAAIHNFYQYLKKTRKVTDVTIATYDRIIRRIYKIAVKDGYLTEDIMLDVPKPKASLKPPDPFTKLEVSRMIDGLTGHEMETLYKAIILMVYDIGVRSGALCKLKLGDVDMETGDVLVIEKGGKYNLLRFGEKRTPEALTQWLAIRPKSEYFFVNRRGKQLKPRVVWYAVQVACKRSGVRRRKEHNLRKSAGCEWTLNGMSPEYVQRSLGHTDFKVTYEHYIQPAMDQKRLEEMREHSPADRL